MNSDWLDILNKVKTGEISVEEASRRMDEGINAEVGSSQPRAEQTQVGGAQEEEVLQGQVEDTFQPDIGWWGSAWMIPFWAGTVILVLGALLMGWGYSSQRFFWFYCAWLPFFMGLLVLLLGVWSRQARWLHVRIFNQGSRQVTISMPLPLRLAGWLLRYFGHYIPQLKDKDLADMPAIFNALSKMDGPLAVEVDEADGDRVRVFIL